MPGENIKSELSILLEKLLAEMEKKGMIKGIQDRKAVIETIRDTVLKLDPYIKSSDLLTPEFQKTLRLALICQHLSQLDKTFKLDNKIIFDPHKNKNDLQDLFKFLLIKINSFDPSPMRISKLDHLAKEFVNNMLVYDLKQDKKSLLAFCAIMLLLSSRLNMIENTKDDAEQKKALENLFGGVDPRRGGMVKAVLRETGNLSGISKQSDSSPLSNAFIDNLTRPDTKEDYVGIENQNRQRLTTIISEIVLKMNTTFNNAITNAPHLHSPFSMKPGPKE